MVEVDSHESGDTQIDSLMTVEEGETRKVIAYLVMVECEL
jgi:endo-alpha-1,4-polygalactosaminidase (GH114 family)